MVVGGLSNWKILAQALLHTESLSEFCTHKLTITLLDSDIPDFYTQIFANWYKLYSRPPRNNTEIKQEYLWNNQFILVDRKPVMHKEWKQKGIVSVENMLCEDGSFMTMNELSIKYDLEIKYMDYISLVTAIPKDWKKSLINNNCTEKN